MLMRSDLPRTADMVIVGGGIAGASTAFHAARAGIRPLILERRPAPVTHTTAASTGAFRLQFDNEEEMHLVRETVELLDQFAEITGQRRHDPRIRRQGYLWATTSSKRIEPQRLLVEQQHRWGQSDIELLSGDEVRSRFPYVGPDVLQARFRAGDGFLDPRQLALGLIEGSGAEVVVSCEVTGIAVTDDRVTAVGTPLGSVATTTVVVAAGPFSGVVASMAGVELPLETVVRHKVVVPDLPAVPPTAPMTIDDDTGAHWRPALAGAFLLHTDPSTPPGPPLEDVPPDAAFAFRLLDPSSPVALAKVAPFWADAWRDGSVSWMVQSGQYDMTPDHRPLLGETSVAGLWTNCGYSGHGIMAGPAGSRHLIDLVTGRTDDNPFRLDRVFVPRPTDVL
jgi:sarcosine oxidase, subunit beta